ncbi:hypothetical protein GCM10027063_01340 [Promicromonospora xylanilytica]
MTRSDHALTPRRTRRPGTRGAHAAVARHVPHPLARRSSFAIAAALTSVALTTTATVGVAGNGGSAAGSPGTAAAAERAGQPAGVVVGSAVVTDPEVRSASEKADAVLTDADYVTREGDLGPKGRKRVQAMARDLRALLEEAHDAATTAGVRPAAAAASRTTERSPLGERAAEGEEKRGEEKATTKDAAQPAAQAAATKPTNLADAATGGIVASGQDTTDLPILDTPLAESVDATADAKRADAAEAEAGSTADAKASATEAPSAADIEKVTTSLQRLITKADGDAVVSVKAGPTPEEIAAAKKAAQERREARAARAAEREAREAAAARAAQAKEMAQAAKSYGNGQIPSSVLCELSWAGNEQLRCDAAAALEDLNGAFRATFGRNLALTDGYRSYAEQVTVAATKGGLAAVPGTSNHGLGQAVDLSGGIESFGTAEHAWMVANAGKYGWKLPGWAQAGGSKPEAWHWEYGTSY